MEQVNMKSFAFKSIMLLLYFTRIAQSQQEDTMILNMELLFNMVEKLTSTLDNIRSDVQHQENLMKNVIEEIHQQNHMINDLKINERKYVEQLKVLSNQLQEHFDSVQEESLYSRGLLFQPLSDAEYQHSAFGCVSDELSLSCPDDRLINVTKAYYGMLFFSCESECCAPHPTDDCRELVEENRPEDWLTILYLCNNKTTCTYDNRGSHIDECQEGYLADWLQIYYQCTPVPTNAPIGFTAYAPQDSIYYLPGEVAKFPDVVTNLGGYYDAATSVFICPVHGVYIFTVQCHNDLGDRWYSRIMREAVIQVSANAWAVDEKGHAGAILITECEAGEQVWILGDGTMRSSRASHFSGYLLHRY